MDREGLRRAVRGRVLCDEPMARHTTLSIGGPADALAFPADAEDAVALVRWCEREGVPWQPVGGGSNLLVRDGGVGGVLLSTRDLGRVERTGEVTVEAEAGVATGKLLSLATRWELGGLEFLGGVPGSVGGGLVMNAGTYLGEFKDVTVLVRSVAAGGRLVERDNAACAFVYRGSALPPGEAVLSGRFRLRPRPRADIEADVRGLRERRRGREPRGVHNAGSIFKNPPGDYAGRLIEACGLKGRRAGAAAISPAHANWIVHSGGATAADVLALIDLARTAVRERFGIELELEVKVIGEG